MNPVDRLSPFRVGSRNGRHNLRASSVHVSYKPPAIRFICLLGFTALFIGCIASIEWLVSETSTVHSTAAPTASFDKRKLTTITTYGVTCDASDYPEGAFTKCTMNRQEYLSQSAVIEKSYSDLCSVYSRTFVPYQNTTLPVSLRPLMKQWIQSRYTWNQVISRQADKNYLACTFDKKAYCSDLWWYQYNSTSYVLKTFTVGCSTIKTLVQPPCEYVARYELLSDGSFTTSSYGWCGARLASQMIITTDISTSTSINLGAQQANKAIAEVVPLTTSDARALVSTSTTSSQTTNSRLSTSASTVPSSATRTSSSRRASSTAASNDVSSLEGDGSYTGSSAQATSTTIDASEVLSSSTSLASSTITSKAVMHSAPVQSTQAASSANIPGSPSVNFVLSKNEVIVQRPFTPVTFFVAVFLPAIIAVVIKSMWEVIATSLKLVEPFQRLMEQGGVGANYSLLTQYFESMVSFDIFRALLRGRAIPISSALIYVMVEIAPLIASLSMNVKTRKSCLYEGIYRPCDPVWILNMPQIRLLEAFLLIATVLCICLIWFSHRSRISVAANPGSIASLAALLNHDPLIKELQRIDPDANGRLFKSALKHKLLRLTEHHDVKTEQTRLGFVLSCNHHQQSESEHGKWPLFTSSQKGASISYTQIVEPLDLRQPPRNRRSWVWLHSLSNHRFLISLQLLTTTGFLTILLTYWFDTNTDDTFNRFFNGDSVAQIIPKILFVGLAVIADIQMKHLERVIRITDPFRRLGMRNARPETTISLPLNGTCWSNLGRNFYLLCRYESSQGRMLWATTVGFVACLSDINIIAVAGFLQNAAQTSQSYAICGHLSIICTSLMFTIVVITMVWWLNVSLIRRMPRQPDNIGHILSYLCGSEMLRDWNSVSMSAQCIAYLDHKTRDSLIERDGRRFCFGRMLGIDNKERWCIDYERDQSQVMVIDDVESRSVISVPPIPECWQVSHQIKRKPVPTRDSKQQSGREPIRPFQGNGLENTARQPRFPSLRLKDDQRWLPTRNREVAKDSDILLRH